MQISNDRYFDDRRRHDLALRMIRHEARTCTIRLCTGLTDDRIRRLYQTYASHVPAAPTRRHRGKSPRQIAFYMRNAQMQFEASLLAALFVAFGLLDGSPQTEHDRLRYGVLFCDAYETHAQLLPASPMSFEHAWFLLQLLMRQGAFDALRCRQCDGAFLQDRTTVLRRACPSCKLKDARSVRRRSGSRRRGSRDVHEEIRLPPPPAAADRLGA